MQFIDLLEQQNRIRENIDKRIKKVLDHGKYIMGPEVYEFEEVLKNYINVKDVITCANGTDALTLVLIAWGVKPGDAVFIPSFTYVASAEAVSLLGATPYFIDVNYNTFNIDYKSFEKSIINARKLRLNPKVVISVDLFGQPSEFDRIKKISEENKIKVLIDAAQSFGALYKGKKVGSYGDATTTSFFPAKPLGCYGDGGAIFSNDLELSDKLKSLRFHGKGSDKYDHIRIGVNSRLDTLQAAILLEKIKIFDKEIINRNKVANNYSNELTSSIEVPNLLEDVVSVWAQYTIKCRKRDKLKLFLAEKNIPSVVYYPKALTKQKAYEKLPKINKKMISEDLSDIVLSLPMHPYLEEGEQHFIIDTVNKFYG